jgi:hypothetical protein
MTAILLSTSIGTSSPPFFRRLRACNNILNLSYPRTNPCAKMELCLTKTDKFTIKRNNK